MIGLFILALGIPAFLFWKKKSKNKDPRTVKTNSRRVI
jgi:hypothetical protein